MNYLYDLHLHSVHSDGDYNPVEVARLAKKAGLMGVVLTDHNTLEGYNEFYSACLELGLHTFMGIEISAKHQGAEIHILGYAKEFDRVLLRSGLSVIVEGYNRRIKDMIAKLRDFGESNIKFEAIRNKKNKYDPVTKYDIAEALRIERGLDKESRRGLQQLFNKGGIAYVPYGDDFLSSMEVCRLIDKSGGVSILAHPGKIYRGHTREKKNITDMIRLLKDAGLVGLEHRCSSHSDSDELFFKELANDMELFTIGGSDWHGDIHHPEIKLGDIGATEEEFDVLLDLISKKS